ncbi:hypothetical protein F2Q68_00029743 [Brassica cretica]|uniref:Uncharacterized protein n=2 Tax=Brassica cretica TaxID=69181 RepID=A0A8S9GIV2_BRACR|nr:hypothetical protein F2Q68_00029743 [Brassica cretica]
MDGSDDSGVGFCSLLLGWRSEACWTFRLSSRPRSASAQGVPDPSSDVRDRRAAPARDLFLVRDSIRQLASDDQGIPDQATKDIRDLIEATRSIPARVPFVSSSRLNSFGGPIQQSSKFKRALSLNLEASVLSPDNPHISSSLMGSDDQRLRPSSAKAYWIQHGNADVQSFDLTKVYVLSLNPVKLISLVWYDVFNGSLMVSVHRLASVYRVHIAQNRDVVLEFVPLLCQLSQAIRVFTVSDPFLMNIRVISRQRRPFPTVRSYGSRDTQLLLPANSFRQSSIENPRRSHPPMVLSVIYLLDEVKESLSGHDLEAPIHGSLDQSYIRSLLIEEAIAMPSALHMALTLEFPRLKVFSNNSTLIRATATSSLKKSSVL